jgi:serine phosphatase RsbU (regulator of sigma subunit)
MPFQPLIGSFTAPGIELYSAAEPCHGESVSGDGLFVETGRHDGGLMLLLVDVMGHGTGAADTVDDLWRQSLSLPLCWDLGTGELLAVLHQQLQPTWDSYGRFVAAQTLLVDASGRTIEGANAALPEPRLGPPGGAWTTWPLPSGSPLGLPVPIPSYPSATALLHPAYCLLAFTDGVTEAGHSMSRQFQHGPLQAFLASLPAGITPQHLVGELRRVLMSHAGTGWPEDDTTILCLRRT